MEFWLNPFFWDLVIHICFCVSLVYWFGAFTQGLRDWNEWRRYSFVSWMQFRSPFLQDLSDLTQGLIRLAFCVSFSVIIRSFQLMVYWRLGYLMMHYLQIPSNQCPDCSPEVPADHWVNHYRLGEL